MKTRAITGFFFVIVMLASVMFGPYLFGAFYLVISCLCLFEFYKLIKENTANPNATAGLINGALLFAAFALLSYSGIFALPVLEGKNVAYKLLFLLPLFSSAIFIRELF